MELDKISVVFKALSDENRLKIITILQNGECCACKLLDQLHITQPTLSHHMRILTLSQLVEGRKEGTWMHYAINIEKFQLVTDYLQKFQTLNSKVECVCRGERS